MTLTSKNIRELADKKRAEARQLEYGSAERLRLRYIASEGDRMAQTLDDLKELLGVSYLSVEINDCP